MKQFIRWLLLPVILLVSVDTDSYSRGFGAAVGGARVGPGGAAGGFRSAGAVAGPFGGSAVATRVGGTVVGPAGGAVHRGAATGSYTGPRGTTIDYGAAGRAVAGPLGGAAGRAVGGVQVTTPGGRTFTDVGRVGGAVGPGGRAVAGHSNVGVATGPGGVAVGASGGRTAIGPAGVAHTSYRGGAAVGPYGAVAGGARLGVATGVGGTVVAGSRVGVAGTRYGTYYASGATLRAQGAFVRTGFRYYGAFTPGWYARYPGAWYAAGWAAGRAWTAATWPAVAVYCGYPTQPIYYDYGSTVVYESNNVYVNGEPVATTEQYAQQAAQIANTGRDVKPPPQEEWQPLGVFALVRGDEETSDKIFQLAIDKGGAIRGNYYDAIADNTLPVYGSVDPKSQRAAWSIGDKKETVFEAGVANLTRDETPVLVHFGKDNTQQLTLVRVEKPAEETK